MAQLFRDHDVPWKKRFERRGCNRLFGTRHARHRAQQHPQQRNDQSIPAQAREVLNDLLDASEKALRPGTVAVYRGVARRFLLYFHAAFPQVYR